MEGLLSTGPTPSSFHIDMVHNLPLFPYQAFLSPIQTDWPACSSAIYGQNLETASLPASFQAISKYILLYEGSLNVFVSGGLGFSED